MQKVKAEVFIIFALLLFLLPVERHGAHYKIINNDDAFTGTNGAMFHSKKCNFGYNLWAGSRTYFDA